MEGRPGVLCQQTRYYEQTYEDDPTRGAGDVSWTISVRELAKRRHGDTCLFY
jgi:hypothetical protein